MLEPTQSNFRAERARYLVPLQELVERGAASQTTAITMLLREKRPMTAATRRLLARALNDALIARGVNERTFDES